MLHAAVADPNLPCSKGVLGLSLDNLIHELLPFSSVNYLKYVFMTHKKCFGSPCCFTSYTVSYNITKTGA